MEILKDATDRKVYLSVPLTPTPATMEVDVIVEGKVIDSLNSVSVETDGELYSVVIPFYVVENYDEFSVDWTFEYIEQGTLYEFSRRINIDVITPILSLSEVKAIIGVNKSDAQAREAESLVRHIIYAHTGQKFNHYYKTYRFPGNNKNYITLPARLLELEKFNGFAQMPFNFRVSEDGWTIRGGVSGVPNIKADYYGFHEINGRVYNEFGILPEWFAKDREFIVTGHWGWRDVPSAIKEAAKLLINDYACDDSIYRDRYVDNISAVDWRIQFNSGAFEQTGNVKADQLLRPYIIKGSWAVL